MSLLCLTRKRGESILIGDHVSVTVTQIDRGKVRLAVTAPRDVAVDREEVRERGQQPAPPASVGGRRRSLEEANRRIAELEARLGLSNGDGKH